MKLYKLILFCSALLLLLSISCTKHLNKNVITDSIVLYPAPPDTARIQFLTSISSSLHVTSERSAFKRLILGEEQPLPIKKPYGISLYKGKLYVCDLDIRGLEIIDLENGTFEYFIPSGFGQLKLPINSFLDDSGYLYIADADRRQVVIFDQKRKYVGSLGEDENFKPTDVFVTSDKIWVANVRGSIHVYDKNSYDQLYTLPGTYTKKGDENHLYQPTNIYVTKQEVYVSDFGDFKIKVYSIEGEYLRSIGSFGRNVGQFVRPKGIAVDRNSNLYVVDAAFENVQIFNKEGNLLMPFGGSYKGQGAMWLPAKVIIDYNNVTYFEEYVDDQFEIEYLILVSNQFGPDKINVYGFVETK